MSMEAASRSRRIRLEELKRRKAASLTNGVNGHNSSQGKGSLATIDFEDEDDNEEEKVKLWSTTKLIRSFRVKDAKLKIDYNQLKDSIEKDVAGLQEGVIAADEIRRKEELDLTNIAPKKPNWDLKRDMDKKLAKLSRRDKEARLILIRRRLQATTQKEGATAGEEQVAIAAEGVTAGAAGAEADTDSDSDSDDAES